MSKLADKAKRISFDEDDQAEAPTSPPASPATTIPAPDRPRTAIGAITASIAMGRGVEAENRALKARLERFEDATIVEAIDPARIHPSRYANRHDLSFQGPEFAALKAEIASTRRNVQPIKVRPRAGGQDDFEIVYGHRRHRACLELGIPVFAIIEQLDDAALFGEMERENRERQSLSPWEQGVMYKRALEAGLYPSLRKLAEGIDAQVGNVSTAISLASLPAEIIGAFPSPLALQFRWAAPLKQALEKDGEGVIARAREICAMTPRPGAKDVYARLLAPPSKSASGEAMSEKLVVDGKTVGRWERASDGTLTLKVQPGTLSAAKEARLLEYVRKLLG